MGLIKHPAAAKNLLRQLVSGHWETNEALFRTVKCRPGYPVAGFENMTAARKRVQAFAHWYNTEHCHNRFSGDIRNFNLPKTTGF
ncbi:hypothetical protein CAI21_07245 [Alkalilimnicola ehrlichii]|uniref:Integrase catalytic domain-containing protein n=1 Tax=Alkalilimnicola ehrlichii TaxID=351052 RepID=A0A3E0WZC4_9GAMM|nr:hypothetical protein [Alkalilimnicola ehrlichii]RFA30009.1 hypothetical protein CAI21_07245 [Alkalilimnicola ehrlichii]RFA37355.1 hypothetical protein CAL65_08585 [Alkalilimnicola ehrlichii]